MTEPIVDIPENTPPAAPPSSGDPTPPAPPANTDFVLPEKFKTPQALLDSYTELEKKMATMTRAPEEYNLQMPEGVEVGEGILSKMKDSGFNNDQAQAVMDMFKEDILPTMVETTKALEQEKLANSLGMGKEAAVTEAQRVLGWAKEQANGEDLVKIHQSTAAGVLYLRERMLRELDSDRITPPGQGTPKVVDSSAALSSAEIDRIVQDPRYLDDPAWRATMQDKINKAMLAEQGLELG